MGVTQCDICAVVYNCTCTHLTFTERFHADWLWQLTSGSEITPQAKPANPSSKRAHIHTHTHTSSVLLCGNIQPSIIISHSLCTDKWRMCAEPCVCDEVWQRVPGWSQVLARMQMKLRRVCLLALYARVLCIQPCLLSMKENVVWMLLHPIMALTQLFVLQGLNCVPARIWNPSHVNKQLHLSQGYIAAVITTTTHPQKYYLFLKELGNSQ